MYLRIFLDVGQLSKHFFFEFFCFLFSFFELRFETIICVDEASFLEEDSAETEASNDGGGDDKFIDVGDGAKGDGGSFLAEVFIA